MRRVTHMALGAAAGALISSAAGQPPLFLAVVGGFFGVVPDLDLLVSCLGKNVHRSPATHSLLASILFACAWAVAVSFESRLFGTEQLDAVPLWLSSLAVFGSAFLHAASDSATIHGCILMFPLTRRRYRGLVRYDDVAANSLLLILSVAVIAVSFGLGPV